MSERKFIFSGFSGCSNHSCVVHGNRTGMGTNGACHCVQHATPSQLNILAQRLDHAINKYDETIRTQQATIDRLTEQRNKLLDVDTLAEIIRKVDGNHNLGAGALAEALIAEIEAGK